MQVGIFTRGEDSHSYKYEDAFAKGLVQYDIYAEKYKPGDRPLDINLGVVWGVNNRSLIEHFIKNHIDYLVLERGYIGDRMEYTSCGFNGLNGRADFVSKNVDDKRIYHIERYIQPPRKSRGEYILINGQIASDASVKAIGFNKWLQETHSSIAKITDRKVYYRPHPLDVEPFIPDGLDVIDGNLQDAMGNAHCVVTLNSNSAVDATVAGIPSITMDKGSMAYKVTKHQISDIINCKVLHRNNWLREMSYCQWTINEMRSGQAWNHLRGFYEKA